MPDEFASPLFFRSIPIIHATCTRCSDRAPRGRLLHELRTAAAQSAGKPMFDLRMPARLLKQTKLPNAYSFLI
jgi:hypothetical protein